MSGGSRNNSLKVHTRRSTGPRLNGGSRNNSLKVHTRRSTGPRLSGGSRINTLKVYAHRCTGPRPANRLQTSTSKNFFFKFRCQSYVSLVCLGNSIFHYKYTTDILDTGQRLFRNSLATGPCSLATGAVLGGDFLNCVTVTSNHAGTLRYFTGDRVDSKGGSYTHAGDPRPFTCIP